MNNTYLENTQNITMEQESMTREKQATQNKMADIIKDVSITMKNRGYNPVNQLTGFLISSDPTYITSFGGARVKISQLDTIQILEEMVSVYLDHIK